MDVKRDLDIISSEEDKLVTKKTRSEYIGEWCGTSVVSRDKDAAIGNFSKELINMIVAISRDHFTYYDYKLFPRV